MLGTNVKAAHGGYMSSKGNDKEKEDKMMALWWGYGPQMKKKWKAFK